MKALKSISKALTKEKLVALMQHKYNDGWYQFKDERKKFKFSIEVYEVFQEINKTHFCIDMHFSDDVNMPTFRVYISNGDGILATNGKGNSAKHYKVDTWYIYSDLANVLLGYAFESKYKISLPNRKSMSADTFLKNLNDPEKDIILAYIRNTRACKDGDVGNYLGDYVLYYSGYTKLPYMYQKKVNDELYYMKLNNSGATLFTERYTLDNLGNQFDTRVLLDLYLGREFYSSGDDIWHERKWVIAKYDEEYTMHVAKKQEQADKLRLSKLKRDGFTDAEAGEELKKLGCTNILVSSKGEAYSSKKQYITDYKEGLKELLEERERTKYADSIEDEVDVSKV